MARTRILKEELEYVCAQRNLTLARKAYMSIKKSATSTEEDIEKAKAKLDLFREKADKANSDMVRAGLSKGGI
jgi:hypothetical protein